MPETPDKFFLTTPIYYVNARPHIGHAYTTIVADVLARRARAQGIDTYFLTGTDEHGQKIERSAAAAGIPPQQFADQVSAAFRTLWDRMGITYNQFIRTTSPAHKRGVQKLFQLLLNNGAIYLSSYTGSYCVSDEAFVDLPAGTPCPDCGRPLETVTEENYFFRLSAYQERLLDLIESNTLKIEPESRRNEVLSFLRGDFSKDFQTANMHLSQLNHQDVGANATFDEIVQYLVGAGKLATSTAGTPYLPGALKDLSISRTSFKWGIPIPNQQPQPSPETANPDTAPQGTTAHPEGHGFSRAESSPAEGGSALPQAAFPAAKDHHVIYVWLDALANYITALGFGSDDTALFDKFWPADLHLVGKEIIRFHCVYWPAFLLAAGLPLPKQVVAHGWLLFEESKMSKSRGNIVRTETILDAFGPLCPPPTAAIDPTTGTRALQPEARKGTPSGVPQTKHDEKVSGPSGPDEASANDEEFGTNDASGRSEPLGTPRLQPWPSHNAAEPGLQPLGQSAADRKHHQDLFAADVLRYFLLREIPFGQDGSFSFDALITRYNADLANGYGNLVSRTLSMIAKYFDGVIPQPPERVRPVLTEEILDGVRYVSVTLDRRDFSQSLSLAQSLVAFTDIDISADAPWKRRPSISDESQTLYRANVLYPAAESIRIITALLYPILPYATASVWRQLGLGDIETAAANGELKNLQWGGLQPGTKLGPLSPIFPRADKGLAQIMSDMENPKPATEPIACVTGPNDPPAAKLSDSGLASEPWVSTAPDAAPRTTTLPDPNPGAHVAASAAVTTERPGTPPHTEAQASGIFAAQPTDQSPQITIDDFAKIDLRVARIVVAERIPKADKLLRLEVDLGYEARQILSGIAEWYTPEELVGRRIVVIANLAPRKMRGLESHGMLLAASTEGGKPHLATFLDSETLPLGSRLR